MTQRLHRFGGIAIVASGSEDDEQAVDKADLMTVFAVWCWFPLTHLVGGMTRHPGINTRQVPVHAFGHMRSDVIFAAEQPEADSFLDRLLT